jgi:choloylglycine hydrolase
MSTRFNQILLFISSCFLFYSAYACTDIRVKAKDGTVIMARSMEFAADLHSNLRTSPRGRVFTTQNLNGKPGLTWKAKYGYVFLDGMNVDSVVDGMNEAGLSIEDLFFPGFAAYQAVPAGQESKGLGYMNFGDWVLGNFKTVDEVKAALASVYVFTMKIPTLGDTVFPLHWSITDATGKGIIVEFTHGNLDVYDSMGVMTNSPGYNWHVLNLNNYTSLVPTNPADIVAAGVTYGATGQGYGMTGLPGDVSPPSRFVKMAELLHVVIPAQDATEALNLAEHVINNVDIPFGLVREPQSSDYVNESTEWVVFKDLTHHIFYYRTYLNLTLQAVDMTKLNFAENATRLKMPIANKQFINDITSQFLQTR